MNWPKRQRKPPEFIRYVEKKDNADTTGVMGHTIMYKEIGTQETKGMTIMCGP